MKTDDTRKRLIEESVRLIEEKGLSGLSFREMARRAGLSHQAPYHHFVNREGILAAIALEGFTMLDTALVEARGVRTNKTPQRTLQAVIRAYVTFALEHQVHFRVMFRPELVPLKEYPNVMTQAKLSFERLVDAVAECHPDMKRNDRRLLVVSNALWAAAHGLATLWVDGPMRATLPQSSLASLIEVATEIFSEAGALTKRIGQRRNSAVPATGTT